MFIVHTVHMIIFNWKHMVDRITFIGDKMRKKEEERMMILTKQAPGKAKGIPKW